MHIDSNSCGQGAPSLFSVVLSGEGFYKTDVVIVADTGWERDCLWSTGERTTNREFFERVTLPLANKYGMDAVFVRSKKEDGSDYPPLDEFILESRKLAGTKEYPYEFYGVNIPMFGSGGGRLTQTCTSKWKIQAIRQELRRRGATTATCAQGLHLGEIHRVKPSDQKWNWFRWPLIDLQQIGDGDKISDMKIGRRWNRNGVEEELKKRNIPYLVTTQCDGCPHKDSERWNRTSKQTIDQLENLEDVFDGKLFLTSERIPLKEAIAKMNKNKSGGMFDESCDSGFCFI